MGLVNTIMEMVDEVQERTRRMEANARRREQAAARRQEEARAQQESQEELGTASTGLLGIPLPSERTEQSIRNRYAGDMRERLRNRPRPGPTRRGFQSLSTNQQEYQPEVASYHNSRYAGNADDQGQPYYMPPPVGTGYDLGMVLANMNQRFLENRERVQRQRAIQVAQFQAANRVRQEQNPPAGTGSGNTGGLPTPGNTAPPTGGGGSGNDNAGSVNNSYQNNSLLNAGEGLSRFNQWSNPNPIPWDQQGMISFTGN